jgi:hypothetical protein
MNGKWSRKEKEEKIMAKENSRSFITFLKEEYDLDWSMWVKLGESTNQIDIDYVKEILDSYAIENGETG